MDTKTKAVSGKNNWNLHKTTLTTFSECVIFIFVRGHKGHIAPVRPKGSERSRCWVLSAGENAPPAV